MRSFPRHCWSPGHRCLEEIFSFRCGMFLLVNVPRNDGADSFTNSKLVDFKT